jgi:tetratricopeptide (TPR) repeat protein
MNRLFCCFTIVFQLLFIAVSNAQPTEAEAKELFKNKNYLPALVEYKKLLETDSSNLDYNYCVGLCYLEANIDQSKAIPYLEKVAKESSRLKFTEAPYYLGLSYSRDYRFDDAIKMFKRFHEINGKSMYSRQMALDRIKECERAKEMMKTPIPIRFFNMEELNSEYADYYPLIASDGSWIMFNSHRENPPAVREGVESNVFIAKESNGNTKYEVPKGIPSINTANNPEVVGMSAIGDAIFICVPDEKDNKELYLKYQDQKKRQSIETINSKYDESSACMSADGKTIIFSSNRKGGLGGYDLYRVRKLPTGDWSIPMNLGAPINSAGNEEFPLLSHNEEVLYFSSDNPGKTMGGYDLFICEQDISTGTKMWKKPTALPYPINTPADEKTISFTKSGEAYISTIRAGGKGGLDIYRISTNY